MFLALINPIAAFKNIPNINGEHLHHIFIFISILLLLSCQQATPTAEREPIATQIIPISSDFTITFLDSLAATNTIIKDTTEGFFQNVTSLDMAIQMKKNYPAETPRAEILAYYKNYLKSDVTHFTKTEADFVQRAFLLANDRLKALPITLLPNNIELIKTTAQHYGAATYYTRENAIIVPDDELATGNLEQFTNIMLHEIFHIYSRNQPAKRLALYELIGFRPFENIDFPAALRQRLLLNPDGINPRFGIHLKGGDSTLTAIPLIVSQYDSYKTDVNTFFDYLYFDLFPLKKQTDSSYVVQTKGGWRSPIHYADFPDFQQQIRDNTDYIIHPDEILADNFVLLVNDLSEVKTRKQLSKDGKKLLKQMQRVMME